MIGRRLSRTLTVIGVLVAAVVLTWVGTRTVDAIVGIALLLIVPGWLITSWRSYLGARWDTAERLYWILVVSLGGVVLSGILLNAVGEMTRKNWIIWEVGMVLVLLAIEWLIALWNPRPVERGLEDAGPAGATDGAALRRRTSGVRLHLSMASPMNIVLAVVSVILVVSSLWLSEVSTADHQQEPVIQLSMKPVPITQGSFASVVDIGVANQTGVPVTVEVRLYSGSTRDLIEAWSVHLRQGQPWSKIVSRSPKVPLVATVAYAASLANPIASVSIGTPTGA